MSSIFYDTSSLTVKEKKALCKKAKSLCYQWWVDELDCSKSWSRKQVDMPFIKIMDKLNSRCHFTVIIRNPTLVGESSHIEIGFSTMNLQVNYFLWIDIKIHHYEEILKGLEPRRV